MKATNHHAGEEPSASAPQVAEGRQAEKPAPTKAPSASAPQAAEGGQASGPVTQEVQDVEMDVSKTTPVKEGAGTPNTGSVLQSPALSFSGVKDKLGEKGFTFVHPRERKWKAKPKTTPDRPKKTHQGPLTINRFQPFMAPEEDEEGSYYGC